MSKPDIVYLDFRRPFKIVCYLGWGPNRMIEAHRLEPDHPMTKVMPAYIEYSAFEDLKVALGAIAAMPGTVPPQTIDEARALARRVLADLK